jgi:hypothetical protein
VVIAMRTPTQKYDVIEGGKRLVTLHSFDVVQQVIREIASRDAKAAAEWAVRHA